VVLPGVDSTENAANITCRSDVAISFVEALLKREPVERPSADEALDMPWMLAARQGNHLPEEVLPSLRPMLHSAKMTGAFEERDLNSASQVDCALNALQMERRLAPSPTISSANIVKLRTRMEELERGLSDHSTNSGSSNVMQDSSSDRSFQNEGSKASGVKSL